MSTRRKNVREKRRAAILRTAAFWAMLSMHFAALVDGVLDERQAAQLADDKHVLDGGPQIGGSSRPCLRPCWGLARTMVMAPTGADFRAKTVADAFVAVHDYGFAA